MIYDRDPVVRRARIGASTASVCLAFFGCGVSSEQPLVCGAAPRGLGEWSDISEPTRPSASGLGDVPRIGEFASDPSDLIFVEGECGGCIAARLMDGNQWIEESASGSADRLGAVRSSPHFIAIFGGSRFEQNQLVLVDTLSLIDRRTGEWSIHERPAPLSGFGQTHWTGNEFLMWGERQIESIRIEPETEVLQHYDGALLDPETLEWTMIPPARDAVEYTYGEGGPSLASVWTPDGLFVWGTNPERSARWGAIFDRESMSWSELEVDEELPPLWQNHSMIALGGDVYLYGGGQPGKDERSRRLFRYSLDREQWIEISVPVWADPQEAAIVNDKLVFMGRCTGGSRYDPVTDTWDALAVQGGPPSPGKVLGFGNYLAVTDTEYHPAPTFRVWLLELAK